MHTEAAQVQPDSAVTAPRSKPPRNPGGSRPLRQGKLVLVTRQSLDQRTLASKQFDRLVSQLTADLGGDLSTIETRLVESFAGISLVIDNVNTQMLLGKDIDVPTLCQLSSTLLRLGNRLGLRRKPRDVTQGASLGEYLEGKADKGEPGDDDEGAS
jgi:hypothetical protein